MKDISRVSVKSSVERRELIARLKNQPGKKLNVFPVSFSQQRMWVLDQLAPGTSTYTIAGAIRLLGKLNQQALEHTLSELVARHEALRTVFRAVAGRPVQLVLPPAPLKLAAEDLSQLSEAERESQLLQRLTQEAARPFDLASGPLFRPSLFHLDEQAHVLLLSVHHSVFDGWSQGILLQEFMLLYEAFVAGAPSPLPPLPLQYADFARWQRDWLQGTVLQEHLSFWKELLHEPLPTLDLPTDHPRPPVQTFAGGQYPLAVSASLTGELRQLSQQAGATLFMTILAAFQVLLFRYSGQNDVLVGTPVANRTRPETEGLIGCFINTLVLRSKLTEKISFRALLSQVRQMTLDVYAHQDVPFEKVIEELHPQRDLSRTPLFQVMFVLQNAPQPSFTLKNLSIHFLPVIPQVAKFDLTMHLWETPQGLQGHFEYNADLFEEATIARMATHFQRLLEGIVAAPDQAISALPLLTASEERQILLEWNATASSYPAETCLHELIEAQVLRTPQAIALVFEGQCRSYEQLNEEANQLAHLLQEQEVGPNVLVGVCMERCLELVVALLGILKAGGAYVPLEPSYPQERLRTMLLDAALPVVLTQSHLRERLPTCSAQVLLLDSGWNASMSIKRENPHSGVRPQDALYLLYTSGSTGQPKGVLNIHQALCNRLYWMQQTYQLNSTDRVMQKTPFSFDVSVWEFFWPLLCGAGLVIARPGGHQDPAYLADLISEEQVTTLHFVPSMLQVFLQQPGIATRCGSLRRVISSGEALSWDLQQQFFAHFEDNQAQLHNLYGPTEAAIDVTSWPCHPSKERAVVPIGQPIANTQIYLLDTRMQPVPIGVPGELYIGGVGLARGYHRRGDLTAERFVPSPFGPAAGARLYKTGDLARYRPDGTIEYLGRADQQVKLRGFRIELGEIEAALRAQVGIQEAIVLAREDRPGEQLLVAYVVVQQQDEDLPERVRSSLRQRLPEYMVPTVFVQLAELPLTSNGKVDRKRLPDPQRGRAGSQQSYVAPRSALEQELAHIWSEVLGIERIGVQDNFFESGGHSLKATQVLARVQQGMQVQLPLRRLFEQPTIAGLARAIEQAREQSQGGQAAIPRREDISVDEQFEHLLAYLERISASELSALLKDEGEKQCLLFPVSFSQQRMWVLDQLAPGTSTYTIAGAIRLLGELDQQALEHTLSELVARHEALRTVFRAVAGRPVQLVQPASPLKLAAEDLSVLSEAERESQLQRRLLQEATRPFDLASGPLFRPSLFRLADRQHVLLLSVHHSVFDGWSQGVLLQEFMWLYEAFVAGSPSPLPPLPLQYADFAHWQRSWFEKSAMREQLVFWQRQLAAPVPSLDLPVDRPRQPVQTFTGANFPFTLPVDETRALTALSQQQGVTLFTTLLAAFCILLARYSGQTDILVGTPVANRTRAELESLIGCFINTLVLRTQLADHPDLRTFLKRVQHVALEAYAHQDIPFEKIVEELAPQRDLSRSPFFQVMFVLQNAPQPPLALQGFTIENVSVPIQIAKFDLTLYIIENEQGLQAHFEYNTDLFEETTIARMAVHFQRVLQAILSNLDCKIGDVPLLTSQERQHLLITLNQTAQPFPDQSCLHHLIEAQVALAPDAQALRFADRTLTYQQLDHRANQLAHYLQAQGIGPDCLVGIYLPRSFEMVIAILATLKAGGAYLPLDSSYPAERLTFMVQDAQAVLILTQESLLQRLPPLSTPLLCLDHLSQSLALQPVTPCRSLTLSKHLAYVIYTSGSTGRPKGTMIPHRGLVNYLSWASTAYQVAQGEGCPVHSSLSFDLTVTSLFLPLLSQRCVTLLPDEPEDLEQLGQLFTVERDYSLLKITPAHLALLRQQVDLRQTANGVRRLVVGGEPLQAESLQGWLLANPSLSIVNEYGPTETVVGCCIYTVDSQTALNGPVPIGRPIANTQLYLLDAHLQPTPIGVAGDLYIAGAGLARGYLNRPDQTAERFLPHPFSASPGARMYRTGDLARYRVDGTLEYVGRRDQQVKIRGYRIELGEIEAVLRQQPEVEDAVVLAREDRPGDKRLVAYVVNKEHNQDDSMLRNYLRTHIPEYMIPSTILFLPQLPLTSNGKVDLRALPIPDREKATQGYIAPSTPLEEQLAQIWAEVLGLERVGIHDNFFELGGHSLQAAQILAYMREKLQKGLSLSSFFKTQTIAEVALLLEARRNADTPILIPLRETGTRPPLYCFHPAGGEVVMYQELAACLDKDQPIYGVQSRALEGMHPEYESLEAMAHEYALALRQHQPEGPYYLLGWSMGGVIAVAVASELERANQEIAFVGLLDAYLTSPELVQGQQADEFEGLGVIIEVALTRTFLTLSLEEQQATRASILALPRQERLPQVLKWGKERKLLPESLSLEILQLQEALVNTHLDLVNAYQAPVVETPLVVWRACEVAFVAQAQTPWQNYTRGGIQEILAKGNHFTMIKPPHIQTLAQQIEGILNASLANKAVARE